MYYQQRPFRRALLFLAVYDFDIHGRHGFVIPGEDPETSVLKKKSLDSG